MKNKNNILLLVVLALVVILIGWPAWTKRNQQAEEGMTAENEEMLDENGTPLISVGDGTPVGLSEAEMTANESTNAAKTMPVKIFFADRLEDPDRLDCTKVSAVARRVVPTSAIGRAALEELLTGPTDLEIASGYETAINDGTKLNGLTIESGVATADFDESLGRNVAGSCRVETLRAQIEATLKQFGTVDSVIISINGVREGILQP